MPNYWAFCANPANYRIEDAVRELEFDYWTTAASRVHVGDRAIIWKTLGGSKNRGIVALAEVVGEPTEQDDSSNQYWVEGEEGQKPGPLAKVRYLHAPNLPLWIDRNNPGFLDGLSVAKAQGGTVFKVTPEQWERVLEVAGGWPEESSEAEPASTKNPNWTRDEVILALDVYLKHRPGFPAKNDPDVIALSAPGHKFAHVFYAATGRACFPSRARSIRSSSDSRSLRVNFHSNGWAMLS
jgi:predicted RNA-binding protein with PUA-like domain